MEGRSILEIEESTFPHDGHITGSYDEQDEVEEQILDLYRLFCEKHRTNPNTPVLTKDKHSSYLRRGLYKFSNNFEVSRKCNVMCYMSKLEAHEYDFNFY